MEENWLSGRVVETPVSSLFWTLAPRSGSYYSDIHDQEVLYSLSDRPWKEKEGWNANRRLVLNSPDPIVPILGTSSAKVTEWVSRQSLKRTMSCTLSAGLRAGILPEVYIVSIYPCVIPVEAYTRRVGAGRTISKRTLHSLDREDRQDFVIRCRTYSNSKSSDRIGISISIRSELLLNCSFNEYSQYYALKRTRTSTLFSTRFWVSRVYHFTTKASWNWIVFHEYDIYLVWCMEYMTKVEYWSISIDRSCHIGPSRTSNCFDLNYPEDALHILILYQIKKMDNQTYFSIQ